MSDTPKVGDTVTWTVMVCPAVPPDAPIRVGYHTRRGRVVEVFDDGTGERGTVMPSRGVLVEPLGLEAYPDRVEQLKEFYVSLQPAGLAPMALWPGQYRPAPRSHG